MNARHRCGGCKQRFYCNELCQQADWRTHKEKCKELALQKKNALGNQLVLIMSSYTQLLGLEKNADLSVSVIYRFSIGVSLKVKKHSLQDAHLDTVVAFTVVVVVVTAAGHGEVVEVRENLFYSLLV
jgi:MYND finger